MNEEVTDFQIKIRCIRCKANILIYIPPKKLLLGAGGLYSGVFVHSGEGGEKHALLLFFDENWHHRGTYQTVIIEETKS